MSKSVSVALVLACALIIWPRDVVAAPASAHTTGEVVPGRLVVGLWPEQGTTDPLGGPRLALQRLMPASAEAIVPLGGGGYRLDLPATADLGAATANLLADARVRFVEPDFILTLHAESDLAAQAIAPNDPAWGQQDELRRIQADRAWDITTGRPEIIVAMLDTGVATNHVDLAGKVLPGRNFVTNKNGANDDQGHGTATASVVAGIGNNKVGMAGVCWGCRVLPVKILDKEGRGTSSAFVSALRFAVDGGARVINISAGGPDPSKAMEEAIKYAMSKNVLVVASSGNTPNDTPNYPAAYDGVVAVAASGPNDNVAGFSTFGPFVDVAAPGINISVAQRGTKNGVARATGTSFSAPLVSGMAGLILSVRPELSAAAVRDYLVDTTVDIGAPGRDDNFGAGRISAKDALLAVVRPGSTDGALVEVTETPQSDRYTLKTSGFAAGEELRVWLTNAAGRTAVVRGLVADGNGAVTTVVDLATAARLRAGELRVMGEQSRRVALAGVPFPPPIATYFAPVAEIADQPTRRYFPETGHTLGGGFLAYWEANGGLEVFGFPISEEFQEVDAATGQKLTVQYFQRNRFEFHAQFAGTPSAVKLGLLGRELVADLIFPPAAPTPESETKRYFAQTRHTLSDDFLAFWQANGGLEIFGFPLSEPYMEQGRLVQYFERNRFELFPDLEPRFRVQLGLLGRDLARQRGYVE